MPETFKHDVLIIGGGVSGTALLYMLSHYTSINKIALLEKYDDFATVNSHARNNSQTLHCGDIETNYTLEKALVVKQTANMVVRYTEQLPHREKIIFKQSKMVIGVGSEECENLRDRYQTFKAHFPTMQWLDNKGIEKIEPALVKKRTDKICALAIEDEYTAVNFQALSSSFVEQSLKLHKDRINIHLNTLVKKITQVEGGYKVITKDNEHFAKFVVVSAGGHSLLFAQRMGYGLHYSCLPMAGSFYYTPNILNGKVYTMQNEKLPFAAIHGDPDILVASKTRFGPTALALPLLERHKLSSFTEFLSVFKPDMDVVKSLWGLLKVSDIRRYLFKNILFEIPYIRKRLFLRDARKIIPDLQLKDLSFAKNTGGIRPVMIDKKNHKLHLGEAQINTRNGIIFNMTPSPGATSCLGNAEKDLKIVTHFLGLDYDHDQLDRDLK